MKALVSASLALLLGVASGGLAAADPGESHQAIEKGTDGSAARMEQRMERWTYRTENRVEGQGEGVEERLGQREGTADARMEQNHYRMENRNQWRGERANGLSGGGEKLQQRSQRRAGR